MKETKKELQNTVEFLRHEKFNLQRDLERSEFLKKVLEHQLDFKKEFKKREDVVWTVTCYRHEPYFKRYSTPNPQIWKFVGELVNNKTFFGKEVLKELKKRGY